MRDLHDAFIYAITGTRSRSFPGDDFESFCWSQLLGTSQRHPEHPIFPAMTNEVKDLITALRTTNCVYNPNNPANRAHIAKVLESLAYENDNIRLREERISQDRDKLAEKYLKLKEDHDEAVRGFNDLTMSLGQERVTQLLANLVKPDA